MTNINLYDPSLRLREDPFAFKWMLAIVGLAVLLVGMATMSAKASLARAEPIAAAVAGDLQSQQAAMQAAVTKAGSSKPDAGLQSDIGRAQRVLVQRRLALKSIEEGGGGPEGGFAGRLEALARQSVNGLWLTGLMLRQDDVLLRGRALSPLMIPLYVQRLEHEPTLQGRAFKALDVARPLLVVEKVAGADPAVPPPAPRFADYVEFTLTGPGGAQALGIQKEPLP